MTMTTEEALNTLACPACLRRRLTAGAILLRYCRACSALMSGGDAIMQDRFAALQDGAWDFDRVGWTTQTGAYWAVRVMQCYPAIVIARSQQFRNDAAVPRWTKKLYGFLRRGANNRPIEEAVYVMDRCCRVPYLGEAAASLIDQMDLEVGGGPYQAGRHRDSRMDEEIWERLHLLVRSARVRP